MSEPSPGRVLRDLQQTQAGLRKARAALRELRGSSRDPGPVLRVGWESLTAAHRTLAGIPFVAVNDEVMSRQLAVQRYATGLLVRLRRLVRGESLDRDDSDELEADEI